MSVLLESENVMNVLVHQCLSMFSIGVAPCGHRETFSFSQGVRLIITGEAPQTFRGAPCTLAVPESASKPNALSTNRGRGLSLKSILN